MRYEVPPRDPRSRRPATFCARVRGEPARGPLPAPPPRGERRPAPRPCGAAHLAAGARAGGGATVARAGPRRTGRFPASHLSPPVMMDGVALEGAFRAALRAALGAALGAPRGQRWGHVEGTAPTVALLGAALRAALGAR